MLLCSPTGDTDAGTCFDDASREGIVYGDTHLTYWHGGNDTELTRIYGQTHIRSGRTHTVQKKQEGSSDCSTIGFSWPFYVFVALLFVVIRVFIVAICPVVSPVYELWLLRPSFFFFSFFIAI